MNEVAEFLVRFATVTQSALADRALVSYKEDGGYREVTLHPEKSTACPLIVHSEENTEVTLEFGLFSIAHVYAADPVKLLSSLAFLIEEIVHGHVTETVWYRDAVPCKANAVLGSGADTLTFHRRSGLCLGGKKVVTKYDPYSDGLQFSLRSDS